MVYFTLDSLHRPEYTSFKAEPMADEDQKLCDCCHERPGTNHVCYGGADRESRSLCAICLRKDLEVGAMTQRADEAIRDGHCKYCGVPAETAWGGSSSATGEHFHMNLVCMACYNDLVEYARRPENAFPEFTFGDETARQKVLAHFADREKRQDEFIRARVLKRKSK
jgi:hypothetical protein